MTRKTVLISGVSGFIGRHTIQPLHELGYNVHGFGRSDFTKTHLHFHACDIFDAEALSALISSLRPTHVLHLAWDVTHGDFWEAENNRNWLEASKHFTDLCADVGVKCFVATGTCAEYDWSDGGINPRRETDLLNPASFYGQCKLALFEHLQGIQQKGPMQTAWARLFHLYGEGEKPERLLPQALAAKSQGYPFVVRDPSKKLDFMNVIELGTALAKLVDADFTGAMNIASGHACTIAEFVKFQTGIEIAHASKQGSTADSMLADVSLMRNVLG